MQVKKKTIKLGTTNKNKIMENIYYAYIDKKIEKSIEAINNGEICSLEELRKEVEMW